MADNISIKTKVAAYLLLSEEIKDRKKLQDELKKELDPYLDQADTNTRGSYVIPFSEPVQIGSNKYKELQRVRKESTVLNEERALEFLTSDQAFESAVITVQHIDHDALWDLYVQDFISKEDYDSFFDTTVTWAFQPVKV